MRAVPKAELHLHSEAVISRRTVKRMMAKHRKSSVTQKDINELFSYTDLSGFLDAFIKIQNFFVTEDDLEYITKDLDSYLEDNNIVYCEAFFSPTSYVGRGFDFHKMISVLGDGIKKIGSRKSGPDGMGRTVRILVDVSRSFGVRNAMRNLDLVLGEKSAYIIGIGLGGDENASGAKDFKKIFDKARAGGLHTVVHAGEVCEPDSITDCIKYLRPERIGHGISVVHDKNVMRECRDRALAFEVCPTSNVFMGAYVKSLRDHPVRRMYEEGLLVTLNTDDPAFFKVSLLDEYWNLYSKLGFSLDDIHAVLLNGFKAAFISESKKKSYCRQADRAWKEWFASHPDITS